MLFKMARMNPYNGGARNIFDNRNIQLLGYITVFFLSLYRVKAFSLLSKKGHIIFPRQDKSRLFSVQESTNQIKSNPEIYFFNSLSRSKEIFRPIHPNTIKLYTCGPTIYDSAHVGNFRAFLSYDLLKRVLIYFGYKVDHVCNLTDVDDKIIKRCNDLNVSLQDLTAKYEALFLEDLSLLNIIPARAYPRATQHIPEMVQLVQDLAAKGLAYQSEEGSWYFNVAKKDGYGQQLVSLDASAVEAAGRGDADEYDADKVGVRDFALWKAFKPNLDRDDATWETDIGRGRPGWHLECSAMAKKFLGETIDLHCGGIDLKFPHHENEIAQSEGANGKTFCNCWLHNGFVNIGDEKMSKSKGNFLTLRNACPTSDDIRAYRYLVISSHYRNPLNFTEHAIGAAKAALKRMDRVREQIDSVLLTAETTTGVKSDANGSDGSGMLSMEINKHIESFNEAIADDLSMPRAAASLFGVVKAAENELRRISDQLTKNDHPLGNKYIDIAVIKYARDALDQMDQVFGIFYEVPNTGTEKVIDNNSFPAEVMQLVGQRAIAKEAKDWKMADSLRDQIAQLGFAVKDVKGGEPIISRI